MDFFYQLGMMIKTTKFYIMISVLMVLAFIQGDSCETKEKVQCPFSQQFHCGFG